MTRYIFVLCIFLSSYSFGQNLVGNSFLDEILDEYIRENEISAGSVLQITFYDYSINYLNHLKSDSVIVKTSDINLNDYKCLFVLDCRSYYHPSLDIRTPLMTAKYRNIILLIYHELSEYFIIDDEKYISRMKTLVGRSSNCRGGAWWVMTDNDAVTTFIVKSGNGMYHIPPRFKGIIKED